MFIYVLLLFTLLSGCITPNHYVKAGITDQEAQRDMANCHAKAGQACGQELPGCFQRVEATCMQGEGYTIRNK